MFEFGKEWLRICTTYNISSTRNVQDTINDFICDICCRIYSDIKILFTDALHRDYLINLNIGKEIYLSEDIQNLRKEKALVLLWDAQEKKKAIDNLWANDFILVIDLYEEMRFYYNYIFVSPIYICDLSKDYTYNWLLKVYNVWRERQDGVSLANLIRETLIRYDFVLAFEYIDEYIKKGFTDVELYRCLKQELENFLDRIKQAIKLRNQKDIIVTWLDQLCYSELEDCKFLKEESKDSLFFENSYTITPYTEPTIRYIFGQERTYLQSYLAKKKLEKSNFFDSKLLKYLIRKGYDIYFLAPEENMWECYGKNSNTNFPGTIRFWEALEVMLSNNNPLFLLIDILRETHEPFWHPRIREIIGMQLVRTDYNDARVCQQIDAAKDYIDREIEFYSQLFAGKNQIKIYMSDHGKWNRLTDRRYMDKALHTILFVKGDNICQEHIRELFPLCDFELLIRRLLEDRNLKLGREWIAFEDTFIFNPDLQKIINESNLSNGEEIVAAFQAIQDKRRKYVCLSNGELLIYKMPSEEITNFEKSDNLMYIKSVRWKVKKMTSVKWTVLLKDRFPHLYNAYLFVKRRSMN